MAKSYLKTSRYVLASILLIGMALILIEHYRPPRLSQLKDSISIIQPELSNLDHVSSDQRDRSWIMCGVDTGEEPCPSYLLEYKINRLEVVDRLNTISEKLKSNGWKEVTYPASEKLCTLLRDNVDQFRQGIFGSRCERDFYKDNIKLKIYSAWFNGEGPDKLSLSIRLIDSRHAR